MKNEILKKSIVIFFIITILMNYLLSVKVYADVEIGDNTHLYGEKDCVSILQIKSTGGLKQVIKVYYKDPDTGKKLYAFCIEPSKPGVGTGATDFSGYETYIREKIQDQRIWRALYHGYIGVNWQDTSLECDDDWYYVTKTVIHCLVNNERPSDVYKVPSRIATSDTPYATLEDVQRRGQKALNECEKLYDYAINGTENYREATASIEKVGSFVSDGNNMVQTLKLTANKQIGSYDVKLANFPTGTTYSKSGNVVKIIVPKASITGDIKGTINILNAQVKTCPAFYGQSYNDTWQDYVTAADPYEIATAQATITFNTNNSTIKILKLDSETNKAIPNTTLKIEKDGKLINTVTTKDNGEAIIQNLYPGTYKITEIKANDSYILSNNPTKEVSVKYGETVTVKFNNTHKEGSLKIVKVDSRDNKTPIKNVTFEIWNIELNKKVATKTTGEDGTITIDNLRTGKYKVKETSTNEWYVLNTEEKITTVEYNKTTTLTIENDVKVGYIEIIKQDQDYSNIKLENIEFKILNSKGVVVDTLTTDKNGYAKSKALPLNDTYTVKETKKGANYILSTDIQKVTFIPTDEGKTKKLTFTNKHEEGSLKIVKVDSRDNKTPIKNVTFEIWNVELNKKVATKTTGEDGTITIDNLRTGKYKVKETSTNEWYVLNTEEKITTVEYNKTTTLTIENDVKVGYIEIIKQDADYSDIKLENVQFEIKNSKGVVVDTLTTNKDGYAKSKAIPLDETYFIKETKTTDKYILSTDIQKVTFIPADEGKTKRITLENKHKEGNIKIFKVDADNNKIGIGGVEFELYSEEFKKLIGKYYTDSNGEITINNLRIGNYRLKETATNKWYHLGGETNVLVEYNKTKEVTIKNELKKGSVKVIKVDKDNNQIKIPNVVFEVLDKNNNVLEKIKTDENGIAITNKYPVRDYETLKLHEVETDKWYALNNEITEVKLEIDKVQEVTIENEKKKGQIRVIKVDLDNNEVKLPNVEFEVLNESGEVVDRLKTDKNGEAVTKRLPIDEQYTIREVKTLEKYVLTEETKTVTLKENQIENIEFQNEKKKGQIEVFKVDAENKEIKLEGVEFEVINSNNEVVEIIKTNKDGYAKTSRIPIGEYKLKEIKTDEMHILNNEIIKVDVTTDIVSRLDITNERIKGQIKIVKTSQDDSFISGAVAGTPIENVKFEVYDSNKNKVDEIITNKDGIAITKKLDKGYYTIKEVEAGKWYLLNENEFVTEIKTHGEIVQVDITNESEKPSVDIEKTGIIQTTANQEIRYDFKIKNTGNVPLNNFTWFDYLPTEYVKMSKLITGTYNQDLNYNIYYKTNLNDYKILAEDLNTQVNNYIDFSSIELEEGEVITEFKVDFGTVDVGFESVINPYIFVTVNNNVENEDTFTNKTRIEGYNDEYMVWDEDDHTTKVYEKEVTVKKLPRTGY